MVTCLSFLTDSRTIVTLLYKLVFLINKLIGYVSYVVLRTNCTASLQENCKSVTMYQGYRTPTGYHDKIMWLVLGYGFLVLQETHTLPSSRTIVSLLNKLVFLINQLIGYVSYVLLRTICTGALQKYCKILKMYQGYRTFTGSRDKIAWLVLGYGIFM
jgi:hypothetical protein